MGCWEVAEWGRVKIASSHWVYWTDFIRDALISRTSHHVGAIKALQFNPFRPELMATSGAKGEV